MKHFFLFLLALAGYLVTSSVSAATSDLMMCTMDYTPVCAKVQVQCIRAPCYPIYKTFSNMCVMTQESAATFTHDGECRAVEEGSPAVLSDKLQNSLKRQYDVFMVRVTGDQLARLNALNDRIVTRLNTLAMSGAIPKTFAQEIMNDRMKYALLFLQNLVQTDISYLTDEAGGMRYISRDANMCSNIKFSCNVPEVPFFTDKGCGCKK